jgi:hypothetical protein
MMMVGLMDVRAWLLFLACSDRSVCTSSVQYTLARNIVFFVYFKQVFGAHSTMMQWRMVFSKIVGQVVGTFSPENVELFLGRAILEPVKPHVSVAFEQRCLTVRLAMPTAQLLSTCKGVDGWG